MRYFQTTFFIFVAGAILAQAQLSSPEQFLPTNYGKAFTPHHLVVDYFQYVAGHSDQVVYQSYGYSTEKRELGVAIISSPQNILNLEEIRLNNLKLTGLVKGKSNLDLAKAIIWINFGVHGNEAGTTETSLNLLYQLAKKNAHWLDDVVIIINPSVNPDGLDRYVSWNRSVSHQVLNPDVLSREHQEPWAKGRTNHFYFDLNRDWAWATQKETQQLLKIYHNWMPHVVPDMHEQSPNSSYYFAPATRPYHENITPFQEEFQTTIGQANAHMFDKKGWLYFTKEIFDLFYPGYGDTYPMFNGAVGMTYEQAGHGIAGKGLLLETGDTLVIQDRIDHHTTSSISTIQTAAKNRGALVKAFKRYFTLSKKGKNNKYQAFVIKKGNDPYRIHQLTGLLDRHLIDYKTVKKKRKAQGFSYLLRQNADFNYEIGDLIISTKQPMGVLAKVLFEPNSLLKDSMTYDITAWALPYVYGLEAYAVKEMLPTLTSFSKLTPNKKILQERNYAWVVEWKGANSAAFLAEILQKNIKVRYATKPFTLSGKNHTRGSLIITQADNKNQKIAKSLLETANKNWVEIHSITTGLSSAGPDLGSKSMKLIQKPKIAMVFGDNINATQYGEFWHYLDAELKQPFVAISLKTLESPSIWEFNTLILVDGSYRFQKGKTKNYIRSWIKAGGKLILIGSACTAFDGLQSIQLEMNPELERPHQALRSYAKNTRHDASAAVPGGIIEVLIDNTHPLGFGYSDRTFSLKTNDLSFSLLSEGYNVGRTATKPKVIGYFSHRFLSHLGDNMIFGHRQLGDGQIIYLVHSPIFRGFWEDGKLLVANALFFMP